MEIKVAVGDIAQTPASAVVVNLFEGVTQPGGATGAVDRALGGAISQLIADKEIKGKFREVTIIHTLGKLPASRVVVAGLGKQEDFTLGRVREVAGEVARALRRVGATRAASIVHGAGIGGLDAAAAAQALTEGTILGLYTFRQHQTREAEYAEVQEIVILERERTKVAALERGVGRGRAIAEAVNLARDMANEPANVMTPSRMAEEARKVAEAWGLGLEVLGRSEMRELGMGALLGVAQGSDEEPRFIILRYQGGGKTNLGLLGKGITFDSGGISLKPAEGMGEMKADMSGGAAVIAALRAIGELKPRINVTGLVPATENLPGGHAYRPGDILRSLAGKTIEVISTDAEGRLILADALVHANRLGLSPLVDCATLTGACRIALGDQASGLFTNNQELAAKVVRAGELAGERHWQMPMWDEYKEQIRSDVADIKNTGGRYGGAITAAQFLAEFAGKTPWVHLDIAGTEASDKDRGHRVKGATGTPTGTLVNLALLLAEEEKT